MTSYEIDRRSLLAAGAAATGATVVGVTTTADDADVAAVASQYFRHVVASGDPCTVPGMMTGVRPDRSAVPANAAGCRCPSVPQGTQRNWHSPSEISGGKCTFPQVPWETDQPP